MGTDSIKIETQQVVEHTAADSNVMARVIYKRPEPGTHATDPQVVTDGATMDFYLNYTTGAVKDTDIGTAGQVDLTNGGADYTWLALAALINATANWHMLLIGARPEDLCYLHVNTIQKILDVTADSTNAIACREKYGTAIYYDTLDTESAANSVTMASACLGPESLNESHGTGRNLQLLSLDSTGNTFRYRDIGDGEPQIAVVSPEDKVAFLSAYTLYGTAAGAFTTSAFKVWACTQTSSRQIGSTVAGPAASTKTRYVEGTDFATYIGLPGERLVAQWLIDDSGETDEVPTISVEGGYGTMAA